MVKRAKVTAETFEKRQSAIDKLVGNTPAPSEETQSREEVETQQEKLKGQRTYKPTSFYLDEGQLDKLDDLEHGYKKRTGKRINRNDIIRHLIDYTDLESIVRSLK
jgi:hypothetical protein